MTETQTERPPTLRWWDLAFALVLLVLGVAVLLGEPWPWNQQAWAIVGTLAVIGLLYIWLGRRALREGTQDQHPRWQSVAFVLSMVLVTGVASAQYGTLASLQALVYPTIWVIADGYRFALTWCGALALSIGIGLSVGYLRDGVANPILIPVMIAIISYVFAVVMGTWISRIAEQGVRYRNMAEQLRASQQQVSELSMREGAAAERDRLSRELHDTLTQTITGLVMLGEQAQRALGSGDQDRAQVLIDRVNEASREAMTEARALVATTQPLGDGGLVKAITRVAERLRLDTGLQVHCELEELGLAREHEVVLLRAAQEGLANARKHAKASSVTVTLKENDGGALLRVVDDGVGPAGQSVAGGFGIDGLAERLRPAGGVVALTPGLAGGSVLEVRIPGVRASDA